MGTGGLRSALTIRPVRGFVGWDCPDDRSCNMIVIVMRQSTPIACYGPFGDREIADEFVRVYLSAESDVHIIRNYGIALS